MKWKTKDGQILEHKDMETSHINNCLKLLNKRLSEVVDFMSADENAGFMLSMAEAEDYDNRLRRTIRIFENELRYRKMGKPVGEDFPLPVIHSWEIDLLKVEGVV